MWITKQTCKDVVQTAWASVSKPNAVDKLLGYIDQCSAELLKWNKTTFGNECWNARNHFILNKPDGNLHTLGKRTINFVKSYRDAKESAPTGPSKTSNCVEPPTVGYLKLNFDGVVSDDSFWGWVFILRNEDGHITLIIDTTVGFFVRDILSFIEHFDFVSWSFVKRGGNRVVHDLAHRQPLCLGGKVWGSDAPDDILERASEDMYTFVDRNLI
ncbi:hypothetical protein Cgig2_011307 [Carnegiea gigantea]|uniref:RNase H type-1 domain-containing protein n=1 Tax=Carnegiea gigantea TaxID=171969 RepID=A0A9Q1JRJ8_9CARY|nr:hypothetical protein Cgig2_011307 [Carnegiea gigantea]